MQLIFLFFQRVHYIAWHPRAAHQEAFVGPVTRCSRLNFSPAILCYTTPTPYAQWMVGLVVQVPSQARHEGSRSRPDSQYCLHTLTCSSHMTCDVTQPDNQIVLIWLCNIMYTQAKTAGSFTRVWYGNVKTIRTFKWHPWCQWIVWLWF